MPAYYVALLHHAIGDNGSALDYLERGYAERDVRMVFVGVDPVWEGLRQDRRFTALLGKMNLAK